VLHNPLADRQSQSAAAGTAVERLFTMDIRLFNAEGHSVIAVQVRFSPHGRIQAANHQCLRHWREQDIPFEGYFSGGKDFQNSTQCSMEVLDKISESRCVSKQVVLIGWYQGISVGSTGFDEVCLPCPLF
jgi:hypothetical protein